MSLRPNVLVHPEKVRRVVLALGGREPVVVRTVRGLDAVALVGSQEVDVHTLARVLAGGFEVGSRPADAAFVVASVLPAAVDIHHEARVAVRVGGRVRGDSGRRGPDRAKEDLALRRRQGPDVLDQGVEQAVGERREVVRLPVVACAGRQQRVERLLPRRVRLHADVLAQHRAERPQRIDQRLALRRLAGVADCEREDLRVLYRFRQEGQRWCLARDYPHGELVGCRLHEVAVLLQHRLRLIDSEDDEATQQVWTHRMEAELEPRHHAEVPAPATKRPEEVGVLRRACPDDLSVRCDHLRGFEVVDRHAVLAAQPPEAPAEREAGDAGRGVDPQRHGEAMSLRRCIEVTQRRARLHRGAAGRGVDANRPHLREIDDDAVVADGTTGDVVTAAAHGEEQAELACEINRALHVRRILTANDDCRAPIDHRVPDRPRFRRSSRRPAGAALRAAPTAVR